MKNSLLALLVLSLSPLAHAGDAFSFDRIEFTSIRDEGANPDYLTVHARICLFYNIYTSDKNETPVNCSVPMAYSPLLKESQLAQAAEAELELALWEPRVDVKGVKREFLKIKSVRLASHLPVDGGETQYEIEAANSRYHVKMLATYSLRSRDGSEDLVLLPSEKEGMNTMVVTKVIDGKLATRPLLVSKRPQVIVTSLGEDQ